MTNLVSGLFNNRSSDMVTHAVDLQCELLDVVIVLGVGIVRSLGVYWVVKIEGHQKYRQNLECKQERTGLAY